MFKKKFSFVLLIFNLIGFSQSNFTLNIELTGSKNEIIRAIKKLNNLNLEVTEENLESCLDTAGMGDVDILIRTSGEVRLSNYLLWQNAYAEMFFTQTYWPDFSKAELDDILSDFSKRERRFGAI